MKPAEFEGLWTLVQALPLDRTKPEGGRSRFCDKDVLRGIPVIKVPAGNGYDYPKCRDYPRGRGIVPRVVRRGVGSKECLGRHGWVVARTLAWLNAKLRIHYERCVDAYNALCEITCSIICPRFAAWFC